MFFNNKIVADSGKCTNGDIHSKKNSMTESTHSRTRFSDFDDDDRLVN